MDVGERAERLRVLMTCCAGAPYVDPAEAMDAGLSPVSRADVDLLATMGDKDFALANACLGLEAELRERAYASLERLCAHVTAEAGDLDARVLALPQMEFAAAAELGWLDEDLRHAAKRRGNADR